MAMKLIRGLGFLYRTKSHMNFSGLCELVPKDLSLVTSILRKMPHEEVCAFKLYAENRGSTGAVIWAEAELQRRQFILNQLSLVISMLAILISVVAISAN